VGTGRIYGDTISIGAGTLNNDAETVNGVTKAGTIAARYTLDIGAGTSTTASMRCSSVRATCSSAGRWTPIAKPPARAARSTI
jgi:hypothetical protein